MQRQLTTALLGAALVTLAGTTLASPEMDLGQQEFMAKCAVCHGVKGKGDGLELLRRQPSDLTTLTRNNDGIFPLARVYEVIDGRDDLLVHGTRDMPIWGREYSVDAASYYFDSIEYDPEAFVRTRILALIEYIYTLQK